MDTDSDNLIRFSLRDLLAVTGYVAATLAVSMYANSIVIGIHLSLALFGWIMWRYAHGHLGGIVPALLGGDLLLCSSVAWVFQGAEDFIGFRQLLCVVASLLVLVGLGVLVWIASGKQRYWKCQIGIALSLFITLVAWWFAIPTLGNAAIARRQASDRAANNLAMAKAISMIEEALQRHGKAPDSDRLSEFLSGPLPSVRWGGYSQEIQYLKTGDTSYQLNYLDPSMFIGDIMIYSSSTPSKGWFRVPF